ncbi:MAG TPA: hemerythrin domain-containing protein [Casimicrobiaceae bacterium]|nr:hemerythrin domain-containing protein [Casimicrobiaceae bacterium]
MLVVTTGAHIEVATDAVRTILDEHRSIAAVLHGMLYLVREIRLHAAPPNFKALHAMVYYVDAFVERFHHPKEDAYLFRLLHVRFPDSAPLIQRLESEHRAGAEKIRLVEQTLARYEEGGAPEFAAFAEAVQSYAAFHWDHMRLEEDRLIPLARAHLTADDWNEIDEAFAGHSDPLFGHASSEHYEDLFRRVVNLAPAPIGLGPSG